MAKTQTSSFGTGKREAHDSSEFYARTMMQESQAQPLSPEELAGIEIPAVGPWANKIYSKDARQMEAVPENAVALAFTSPPYNVGKDYDGDMDLGAYLGLIRDVGAEVYRVLRPGGRFLVNIANVGRKPYLPLHAYFWQLFLELGFLPMGEIIWQKAKGASGSCAWGSWLSARAPRLRDVHEYILVLVKQAYSRPDKGESDISRDAFLESTLSVWKIQAESARKVGHPAPFPMALAERVIQLYSYRGDVVLDPFAGSGTTCAAAKKLGRAYVGYEVSEGYCALAEERIVTEGL
ncbi:MAG: site-specific DNA-methyltransferase [Anaerolineales bacterium]|nr:site-specific DNA-methyltransferase [Anaerolineales bacterium]